MKSKLLALAIGGLAVTPLNASAGELKLDTRFESVTSRYSGFTGKPNSSSFQVSRARLDMLGNFSEQLSYRFRFDAQKASTSNTKRDKVSDFVQLAFINHTLIDGLQLQAGKIGTQVGGWEGNLSGADYYLRSKAGDEVVPAYYSAGAGLVYTWQNQMIEALYTNPTQDETDADGDVEQDHSLWGLVYKGKLLEGGSLQPVVSFHSEGVGADKVNTYIAAGGRYQLEHFDVEADYLNNSFKGKTRIGETDKTWGAVLLVRYKMNGFNPHLKYSRTEQTAESATPVKTTYDSWTAALEYVPGTPEKAEIFRYHIAVTNRTAESDLAGSAKTTETNIIAGFRILTDLLKTK